MDSSKFPWYIRRKKLLIAIVLFCLLVLCLAFTYQILLTRLAEFLIFKTDISPSDVIIILSGNTERLNYGIKLYKQGYASHIMINLDSKFVLKCANIHLDWRNIIRQVRESKGIPENAFFIVDGITSTYDDARFSLDEMLKNGFESAIVVSSPYHMRRTRMTFDKVYKKSGISLYYSPVEKSWFQSEKWWTRERELITVTNEYIKLVLYWLKY